MFKTSHRISLSSFGRRAGFGVVGLLPPKQPHVRTEGRNEHRTGTHDGTRPTGETHHTTTRLDPLFVDPFRGGSLFPDPVRGEIEAMLIGRDWTSIGPGCFHETGAFGEKLD